MARIGATVGWWLVGAGCGSTAPDTGDIEVSPKGGATSAEDTTVGGAGGADGPCTDADRDGYCAQAGHTQDCNDNDPAVHPNAEEACDWVDNDCDDEVDFAGCTYDLDGDGHDTSTDCDDDDAWTYPGAPEVCDGHANGCDGAAWSPSAEDGMVSWLVAPGESVDLTKDWDGSEGSAAQVELPWSGRVQVCPGTYLVELQSTSGAVEVVGPYGASRTILDGAHEHRLVYAGPGASLTLEGLTLRNGLAEGSAGGAVYADHANLTIRSSWLEGNTATRALTAWGFGGAVAASGGESLVVDATTFYKNDAEAAGGALYVYDVAQAQVDDSVIVANSALVSGGALYVGLSDLQIAGTAISANNLSIVGSSATLRFVDSTLSYSSGGGGSPFLGGALNLFDSDLSCVAAPGSGHGFSSNGTAVYSDLNSTVASSHCDWRAPGTAGNNSTDVRLGWNGTLWNYGSDATFTCNRTSCTGAGARTTASTRDEAAALEMGAP